MITSFINYLLIIIAVLLIFLIRSEKCLVIKGIYILMICLTLLVLYLGF